MGREERSWKVTACWLSRLESDDVSYVTKLISICTTHLCDAVRRRLQLPAAVYRDALFHTETSGHGDRRAFRSVSIQSFKHGLQLLLCITPTCSTDLPLSTFL
jgi:hypothetical protein